MIRRDAWTQMGGMREQFGLLSDIDLWMRIATLWAVGYVPEPLITVRHQRPSYYPSIYTGTSWSWKRQRILYDIHAINRLDYYCLNSVTGQLRWWRYKLRLSLETSKWLLYAVIRKKVEMISSCEESMTPYDLWPLRALRWGLRKIFATRRASRI